jgi:predicted dienelactone hydrolase
VKHSKLLIFAVWSVLISVSCAAPTPVPPTAPPPQATATPEHVAATAAPETTQEPVPFPLSEPGPYHVGKQTSSFEDASRDNRRVWITVWYPAVQPEGWSGTPLRASTNSSPDPSGAPYPLLLSSSKVAAILAPYLVSHGFSWASVNGIDTWDEYSLELIDQPLDILFALEQVASVPPEGLEGMIDAEKAGVTGYSFDGYNALAMSGARVDPEFYLARCARPDATAEAILSILPGRYQCALAGEWDAFVARAGEAIAASEDGLWQPMTDTRIRAVLPLAGEGWLLLGEKGLAAVDRPTLLIVSTKDIWYQENVLILEHLGTPEKALVSFVGEDHMMIYDPEMVARMAHFAVAFFGYHLQGRDDLAYYFSEDFVEQYDDLAWGAYQGEE